MATINPSDIGVASVQTDAFDAVEVFAGDTPPVVTDYGIVASAEATAGIPAWTPVVVNAGTKAVTLASAGVSEPNAITTVAIPAGAPADSNVPVYKAGMFDVDKLNWPASYDTDAEKFAAFSTTDCEIYVKRNNYS